jgi:prepilin-type N-terminal cleavage/methylation domain-containing protein
MRTRHRRNFFGVVSGQAGFTLTELMVGVTLLGMILLAAVPNMAQYNADRKLRSAASDLEATMRRARSSAVTRNTEVRVTIDPADGTIVRQIDNDGDGNFETQVGSSKAPKGVEIGFASFGGNEFVTFDGRGVPDNPGTILLLGSHGELRVLWVAPGSGAVTVSRSITWTPTTG